MMRLMMNSQFFSVTPVTKKYVIKSAQYLIESKPKQPANGYARYIASVCKGVKDPISKSAKWAKQWEKSVQIKEKLNAEAAAQRATYALAKQAYEKKYVLPFTKSNVLGLTIHKAYSEGKLAHTKGDSIAKNGKKSAQYLKSLSTEETQKIKAESAAINAEREKLKNQFKFPTRLYHTLRGFNLKNQFRSTVALNIEQIKEQQKKNYEQYVENWKADVAKWLAEKKYNITIDEFVALYNKTLKDEIKRKQKLNEDSEDSEDSD